MSYLYPLGAIKACQPGVNHIDHMLYASFSIMLVCNLINKATSQVEMNQGCYCPKIGVDIWHHSRGQKVMYFVDKFLIAFTFSSQELFPKQWKSIQTPHREIKLNFQVSRKIERKLKVFFLIRCAISSIFQKRRSFFPIYRALDPVP